MDLFINCSSSEGIPVTIMEAESCGIPISATDVGGNTEIVPQTCGVIIPADPEPYDIAEAAISILQNKETYGQMRISSKNNWNENFNAEKNYSLFISQLTKITIPRV